MYLRCHGKYFVAEAHFSVKDLKPINQVMSAFDEKSRRLDEDLLHLTKGKPTLFLNAELGQHDLPEIR